MANKRYLGNFVIRDYDCKIEDDNTFTYYQNNQIRNLINKSNKPIFAEINFVNLEFPKPIEIIDKEIEYYLLITEKWNNQLVTFQMLSVNKIVKHLIDVEALILDFKKLLVKSWSEKKIKNQYTFVLNENQLHLGVKQEPEHPSPYSHFHAFDIVFSKSMQILFNMRYAAKWDSQKKQMGTFEKWYNNIGRAYIKKDEPDPKLAVDYYFYHSDFTSSNMNQRPLTVYCPTQNTSYNNHHRYYFHSMSSYPKCYFFGFNHQGNITKGSILHFTILITFYEEIFNPIEMRYLGNYVINRENSKIDGDYIYTTQNNQVCTLVSKCRNKNKKLWVKIQQLIVDPNEMPYTITYHETQSGGRPTIERKFDFHYDFRNHSKTEIIKYLKQEVIEKGLKLSDTDQTQGLIIFDFDEKQTRFVYKMVVCIYTKKITFILSENLCRTLGFKINRRTVEEGAASQMDHQIKKTYVAEDLPNFFLETKPENVPILYYYHPDLVSSNFNQEYITAVYVHNNGMYEYDLIHDVRSLSPTVQTYFYYYDDVNKKAYYTPRDFAIVLGFYESD